MTIPLYQVDAFTDRLFAGNPAGVCVLDKPADEQWMQLVAREMNLSETAFISPSEDGFDLRWFTPTVEVDLCGHATLATSHILWETGRLAPDEKARFHTRSGLLSASRSEAGINLDFPATAAEEVPAQPDLEEALGVTAVFTGKSAFDYLLQVDGESIVRNIKPDLQRLKPLTQRGVIVTSIANDSEFDFVSRFFAPAAGIDEDPVTGSAHCCLAPFWSERLGKTKMRAWQASERGGAVGVRLEGQRVVLTGQAVTVFQAHLAD